MRQATIRRRPTFDALEAKELMAGGVTILTPGALTFDHNPLPPADSSLLQQHASAGNLELFLAQLAQASSPRADVQAFADQVVLDHQVGDLQAMLLGRNKDVVIPTGILEPDATAARTVIAALNTSRFDQAVLTAIVQADTRRLSLGTQLFGTTADTDVRSLAQQAAPIDAAHATGAQNLLNGNLSGIGDGNPSAATPIVPASDVSYLQFANSYNNSQILTSQVASLTTTDPNVLQYADKLIDDHRMAEGVVLQLAFANRVPLLPTLTTDDLAQTRAQLATANTPDYDRTYLAYMIPMHLEGIAADNAVLATTQNPNIREYARGDVGTSYIHLIGAQQIQSTTLNPLLAGTNSQNLKVTYRRINNYTYAYTARFNAGGTSYTTASTVRFSRRTPAGRLPAPNKAMIRQALFASLNGFLNQITPTPAMVM